jgi:hypothetical protein
MKCPHCDQELKLVDGQTPYRNSGLGVIVDLGDDLTEAQVVSASGEMSLSSTGLSQDVEEYLSG